MALPHLPTSYTTRKNIYEAAIVRRRTHESDFREKWTDVSRYFKEADVDSTKKSAWESHASFESSMDAWQKSHESDIKKLELEKRRLRLSNLLKVEREQLQAELRGVSGDNYMRMEDMKERSETLRSAREDRRQQLADELLYEHWRSNSPDIRQLELNQHKKHVISQWEVQEEERKKKEEEDRLANEDLERQLEEERLAALEIERQKAWDKLVEEKKNKMELEEQMSELKIREAEAAKFKNQEALLMKEQWELDRLEEHRKLVEQDRKKMEFGRTLMRQHTTALKRKSKQIQEELEEDRKLLEKLVEQEDAEREIQTARRTERQADAHWMKQVVEDQIRLEKAREAELDMLYHDEAARQWQKRESEWEKERKARERLMQEVMDERQQQVHTRMEVVRRRQEESLEQRELLLRELEIANQMTRRDMVDQEAQKTSRKRELDAQISSRKEKAQDSELNLELARLEEKQAESDYEKMLNQEAQRMGMRGYQGKNFGRKQAWH